MKKTAQARNKVWSRNLEREDSGEVGLLVHHRSPQHAAQAIGDANDTEHEAGGGAEIVLDGFLVLTSSSC